MYLGIELGGTKINIACGTNPSDLSEMLRVETTDPVSSLEETIQIAKKLEEKYGKFSAIGIASFGPVAINKSNKSYGKILKTPKKGWSNTDIISPFENAFNGVPIYLDTDVNAAAKSENLWGAGENKNNLAYVTIGTGIGVGLIINNDFVHGRLHPEAGHILLKRDPRDNFEGICPFHKDCLEGMASGPAIQARAGVSAGKLDKDNIIWEIIGGYIGQLFQNLILINSVEKIIIGGGVGLNPNLIQHIRNAVFNNLNNYLEDYSSINNVNELIVHAKLGDKAGMLGAIALCIE